MKAGAIRAYWEIFEITRRARCPAMHLNRQLTLFSPLLKDKHLKHY